MNDERTMKEPLEILNHYTRNKEFVSAREIHKLLGIRKPYRFWLFGQLQHKEILTDYMNVDGETLLSPIAALLAVTGGGSDLAARIQVLYCQNLSRMFKGRCMIELMDTAIRETRTQKWFEKEMDPERVVTPNAPAMTTDQEM